MSTAQSLPPETAPPVPEAKAVATKDSYGFLINQEFTHLYSTFADVWEAEEFERIDAWSDFLMDHVSTSDQTADSAKFDSLQALAQYGLQDTFVIAQSEPPGSSARNTMEALVQGGIPYEVRGKAWTVFLDISVRKQKGYYDDLVERSLGDLKAKRVLEPEEIKAQAALAVAALQADGVPNSAPPDPGPAESTAAAAAAAAAGSLPSSPMRSGGGAGTPPGTSGGGAAASGAAANSGTGMGADGSVAGRLLRSVSIGGLAEAAAAVTTSPSQSGGSGNGIFSRASPATGAAASAAATTGKKQPVPGLPSPAFPPHLESWQASGKVWLQQIEKDLPRTFPGHATMEGSGKCALRRILAAYSLHNPGVGYCQGMNFIAGCLLLFMEEEDAFYCMCTIIGDILAGYYSVNMLATQVDQKVFRRMITEQLPQLAGHMEVVGADISHVFVQWSLCCFVNFLPLETCLRVWDVLFYERSSTVLFKVALALLEIYTPALLETDDMLDALGLVQSMAPMCCDASRLMAMANCPAWGNITTELLNSLRDEYSKEVLREMAELESIAAANAAMHAANSAASAASAAAAAAAAAGAGSGNSMTAPASNKAVSGLRKFLQKVSSSSSSSPNLLQTLPTTAGAAATADTLSASSRSTSPAPADVLSLSNPAASVSTAAAGAAGQAQHYTTALPAANGFGLGNGLLDDPNDPVIVSPVGSTSTASAMSVLANLLNRPLASASSPPPLGPSKADGAAAQGGSSFSSALGGFNSALHSQASASSLPFMQPISQMQAAAQAVMAARNSRKEAAAAAAAATAASAAVAAATVASAAGGSELADPSVTAQSGASHSTTSFPALPLHVPPPANSMPAGPHTTQPVDTVPQAVDAAAVLADSSSRKAPSRSADASSSRDGQADFAPGIVTGDGSAMGAIAAVTAAARNSLRSASRSLLSFSPSQPSHSLPSHVADKPGHARTQTGDGYHQTPIWRSYREFSEAQFSPKSRPISTSESTSAVASVTSSHRTSAVGSGGMSTRGASGQGNDVGEEEVEQSVGAAVLPRWPPLALHLGMASAGSTAEAPLLAVVDGEDAPGICAVPGCLPLLTAPVSPSAFMISLPILSALTESPGLSALVPTTPHLALPILTCPGERTGSASSLAPVPLPAAACDSARRLATLHRRMSKATQRAFEIAARPYRLQQMEDRAANKPPPSPRTRAPSSPRIQTTGGTLRERPPGFSCDGSFNSNALPAPPASAPMGQRHSLSGLRSELPSASNTAANGSTASTQNPSGSPLPVTNPLEAFLAFGSLPGTAGSHHPSAPAGTVQAPLLHGSSNGLSSSYSHPSSPETPTSHRANALAGTGNCASTAPTHNGIADSAYGSVHATDTGAGSTQSALHDPRPLHRLHGTSNNGGNGLTTALHASGNGQVPVAVHASAGVPSPLSQPSLAAALQAAVAGVGGVGFAVGSSGSSSTAYGQEDSGLPPDLSGRDEWVNIIIPPSHSHVPAAHHSSCGGPRDILSGRDIMPPSSQHRRHSGLHTHHAHDHSSPDHENQLGGDDGSGGSSGMLIHGNPTLQHHAQRQQQQWSGVHGRSANDAAHTTYQQRYLQHTQGQPPAQHVGFAGGLESPQYVTLGSAGGSQGLDELLPERGGSSAQVPEFIGRRSNGHTLDSNRIHHAGGGGAFSNALSSSTYRLPGHQHDPPHALHNLQHHNNSHNNGGSDDGAFTSLISCSSRELEAVPSAAASPGCGGRAATAATAAPRSSAAHPSASAAVEELALDQLEEVAEAALEKEAATRARNDERSAHDRLDVLAQELGVSELEASLETLGRQAELLTSQPSAISDAMERLSKMQLAVTALGSSMHTAPAGRLSGHASNDGSTGPDSGGPPSLHGQPAPKALQAVLLQAGDLQRDLYSAQQQLVQMGSAIDQLQALAVGQSSCMRDLLQTLADQKHTNDLLTAKLNKTTLQLAEQDTKYSTELDDKDAHIRQLQGQLQASTAADTSASKGGWMTTWTNKFSQSKNAAGSGSTPTAAGGGNALGSNSSSLHGGNGSFHAPSAFNAAAAAAQAAQAASHTSSFTSVGGGGGLTGGLLVGAQRSGVQSSANSVSSSATSPRVGADSGQKKGIF